jgi:hypothetical protein
MQQRATASGRKPKGALSFGLALPLSFAACLATGARAETASLESLAGAGEGLQQWRDYALAAITPDFSFSVKAEPVQAPTLFSRSFGLGRRSPVAQWHEGRSSLSLGILSSFVTGGQPGEHDLGATQLREETQPGLRRTLITPAYSQRVGEQGSWSVSAVLAYQRFASGDLGALSWNGTIAPPAPVPGADEVSYGRGVRLDYSQGLNEQLGWAFAYQSRVNMDAFNNFRGVFAEPGDFDIPASASAGLTLGTHSPFSLNLGVERVMYSAIRPFTSAALPRRVLAVLGDGTSPVFAWRDLTVYSLGGTWTDGVNQLSLRYSTREQPSPTSHLLEQLLSDEQSRYGVELSYAKAVSSSARFELSASYSPYEYVLGAPTSYSVRHDNGGNNQVEFEALWAVAF